MAKKLIDGLIATRKVQGAALRADHLHEPKFVPMTILSSPHRHSCFSFVAAVADAVVGVRLPTAIAAGRQTPTTALMNPGDCFLICYSYAIFTKLELPIRLMSAWSDEYSTVNSPTEIYCQVYKPTDGCKDATHCRPIQDTGLNRQFATRQSNSCQLGRRQLLVCCSVPVS